MIRGFAPLRVSGPGVRGRGRLRLPAPLRLWRRGVLLPDAPRTRLAPGCARLLLLRLLRLAAASHGLRDLRDRQRACGTQQEALMPRLRHLAIATGMSGWWLRQFAALPWICAPPGASDVSFTRLTLL